MERAQGPLEGGFMGLGHGPVDLRLRPVCATVNDEIEAFVRRRCCEVTGELMELRLRHGKRAVACHFAPAQSGETDLVWNVQYMKLVGGFGALDDTPHPVAPPDRIRGEVEDDGNACVEQCRDVGGHRISKLGRAPYVVLQ